MRQATEPIRIDPDLFYDDGYLVLTVGVTHAALTRARRRGELRFTRRGAKSLYLGRWVLDWLEGEPRAAKGGGA